MNKSILNKSALTSLVLFLLIFIVGCNPASGEQTPTEPAGTATLPQVEAEVTPAPDVELAVRAYLDAWARQDYTAMYNMLTPLSQDAIGLEAFTTRYQDIFQEANLSDITYEILGTLTSPNTAQASYRVTLQSAVVGAISRDTTMDLSREGNSWRVVWDDRIILPELVGGNTLSMERYVPTRGDIYDRNGAAIAVNANSVVAIGVVPSVLNEDEIGGLVAQLATLMGENANTLRDKITAEDAEYVVPIGVVSLSEWNQRKDYVTAYGAVSYEEYYNTRFYYGGGAGPQSVGYVGPIPAEEVDQWIANGYTQGDTIGRIGIESWGEDFLAGTRGGALYVISPDKQIVTQLAQVDSQPADSIYTTLMRDLQLQSQEAIKDFTGAIVVMERDTGRVLTMVSSPGFDPNSADFNNPVSDWGNVVADPGRPFLNRATQGQYPPGSIFKVITLAAALESGVFTRNSMLFCDHTWTFEGTDFEDWTLEKGLAASGDLNLLEGLMRSCNPWFYQIGLSLYNFEGADYKSLVADIARGFGLGSPTGIGILPEESGLINNPADENFSANAAIQQGIGQGTTLITPIQAVTYAAALGNGGTLYQPQLIERIENPNGEIKLEFEPIINGTLPISEETLAQVQEGMRMVVDNPRGTAYRRFANFSISVAGKTGTAQNSVGDPHAWFIGYTYEGRTDKPDIAIVVICENIGDGSEFAAPIFKRVAEVYFYENPQSLYPWESRIGVLDPAYFEEDTEEEVNAEGTPIGDEEGPIELTPVPGN